MLGFDLSLSTLSAVQERFCITEFRAAIASDLNEEQRFRLIFPLQRFPKLYLMSYTQNKITKPNKKRPPPHFQKEIKNLILKQSTVTPGIWEYGFQRENYLSKIPSTSIQCSEKLTDDKAGSKLYSCKGLDASSYIKPGIGKNPALFSKVSLGSGKEEASAHQDMPT